MTRLLHPKNLMVSADTRKGCYLSLLNIIQGEVDPLQVHEALNRIQSRKLVKFMPWGPSSIQVLFLRATRGRIVGSQCDGLFVNSHTLFVHAKYRSRSARSLPTSSRKIGSAGSCWLTTPALPRYSLPSSSSSAEFFERGSPPPLSSHFGLGTTRTNAAV